MWVGVLLGLLVATVVGLLLTVLAHHRGKETQFGYENLLGFRAAEISPDPD